MSALRSFWKDVVNTATEAFDVVKKHMSKTCDNPPAPGKPPTLCSGDKNQDGWVAYLQGLLQANGFDLSMDGDFGPVTAKALRAFQKLAGLEDDGIAGSQTWARLLAGSTPIDPQAPMLQSIVITPPYVPPMVAGGMLKLAATGV